MGGTSESDGSRSIPESMVQLQTDIVSNISAAPETELRQTLKEHHINMMSFSTVLGVGLFLSAGKAIFIAGPGSAILAYLAAGSIIWSAMACMGEMTALFPVKGAVFEFPRRFVDQSVGFAVGWIDMISWSIVAAAEILAITELFRFRVDPGYLQQQGYPQDRVEWPSGVNASPTVWVVIFLIVILLFNLLPVRQYGRVAYVCGCMKIIFVVGLIMFNMILNARQKSHNRRFWTYEAPYSFARKDFIVRLNHDGSTTNFTGPLGGLTSFWTAMTTTIFSLIGGEITFYTAAENQDLRKEENIKIASRKLSLRLILLYTLATFTVSLNVPFGDDNLACLALLGITGGQHSIFIVAAIREHVTGIPHLMNAFFIFSACSTGITSIYAASRTLHALASNRDAWPSGSISESIRSRLERTRLGVPMVAVVTTWLIGFLSFLATNSAQVETLGRITTVSSILTLLVYAVNCIAYLNFFRQTRAAAAGELDEQLNISPEMRALYNRAGKLYPYRSHLQWMRAVYAFTGCMLMVLFQGWRTLVPPTSTNDFVASYIGVLLLAVLCLVYFVKDHGPYPRNWRFFVKGLSGLESVGPVEIPSESLSEPCKFCGARHRRGNLRFPSKRTFTEGNARALVEWIWTWMR